MSGDDPLLSIRDLHTHFRTNEGTVRAVDGVSFDVRRGETVCLVGESGSGKTVTCESITKLIPMPPGEIVRGEVRFDGEDLTGLAKKRLQKIRGGRIGHVFQNPQGALNPVYTVGTQIVEAIRLHREASKREARARAIDLLDDVGIPDAPTRVDDYPHEFSGGMRQRVVIAMALACQPDVLICDEPTTALDVTIQAQILRLLGDLQDEYDMAIVFVTHDLGVVAQIADRVVVMYAGKVMERGDVFDVFETPAHPYTQALLRCLPGRGGEMGTIGGTLPDLTEPPSGCRFHPRCPHAIEDCRNGDQPAFEGVNGESNERTETVGSGGKSPAHEASCVFYASGYDDTVVRTAARSSAIGDGRTEATDGGDRLESGRGEGIRRPGARSDHDGSGEDDDRAREGERS